mmetsp:Transcript_26218/g.47276  ORF Transcript_26218/g.47276 Transcript_26218/m.47276 type:complete len:277 (+) Transcript_26218:1634-2464(+)
MVFVNLYQSIRLVWTRTESRFPKASWAHAILESWAFFIRCSSVASFCQDTRTTAAKAVPAPAISLVILAKPFFALMTAACCTVHSFSAVCSRTASLPLSASLTAFSRASAVTLRMRFETVEASASCFHLLQTSSRTESACFTLVLCITACPLELKSFFCSFLAASASALAFLSRSSSAFCSRSSPPFLASSICRCIFAKGMMASQDWKTSAKTSGSLEPNQRVRMGSSLFLAFSSCAFVLPTSSCNSASILLCLASWTATRKAIHPNGSKSASRRL